VPALHELRISAGLPPYPLSPEMEIEHMLGTGSFPRRDRCARCGTETDATIQVLVQFGEQRTERSMVEQAIFFLIFGWIGLLFARKGERSGFDKVYHLPLHVCPACQDRVRGAGQVRECLCKVDVYDRLLEKHPYAEVKRS
jgi:hypothetical protein